MNDGALTRKSRCRSRERRIGTSGSAVETYVVVPVRGCPTFWLFQFLTEPFSVCLLANLVAQNTYTTEDQYDLMSTMFDKGIDYGAYDNNVYTMAGADSYQQQLYDKLAGSNMMDPTMYLSNPEYAAMAQQVFGNKAGLGSNQTYSEEQWQKLLG